MFWGIGAGWVFTKDSIFRLPHIITFGKLRTSFGTSGNDEIGNYSFDGAWSRTPGQRTYGGITSLSPTEHVNENVSWGLCRKFEIAAEFTLSNLINFTAIYYYNNYTNHLVKDIMPSQTGFGNVIKNISARTVSKGLEFSIQKRACDNNKLKWELSVSATFPRTKLAYFPNFERSNYANILSIGEPVNTKKGFVFLGVNPSSGQYEFLDVDQDNVMTQNDYKVGGSVEPKFYGGINNSITYRSLTLEFLWEFSIQKGINRFVDYAPMRLISNGYSNIPVQLLKRWQNTGDVAPYQAYSVNPLSSQKSPLSLLRSSNALWTNANYLRLRNISVAYMFKLNEVFTKHELDAAFFVASENLILITKYQGADPASQQEGGIPILKRFSLGFKINFD